MNDHENFSHKEKDILLLYIKDQDNEDTIESNRLPTFFDALQVLNPQMDISTQFQTLPLRSITSIKIFNDDDLINLADMVIDFSSRTITVQEKNASYGETCQLLSCFMVKEQNKVLFMSKMPNDPVGKCRKRPVKPVTTYKQMKQRLE